MTDVIIIVAFLAVIAFLGNKVLSVIWTIVKGIVTIILKCIK